MLENQENQNYTIVEGFTVCCWVGSKESLWKPWILQKPYGNFLLLLLLLLLVHKFKKKIKSRTCNFQVKILEMVFIEFRLGSILEDLPPALYENEEECELFLSLTISLKLFFLNYYLISHQFGG
jgi:hypothetical protein